VGSFRDLARHFGALPPDTVAALTSIAEARGRAELYRQQNPAGLETLRKVALVQSTEASNAIENIRAPLARIEALSSRARYELVFAAFAVRCVRA
jgi:hypothetical protein